MKKQPLVSFCIATYKRSDFLKSTIEIILNQKYKNIEIVISEDNSPKTSEKLIKSFKSNRIIYHKNRTHLGMVKSFNKAFSLSHGDFVTILADDDPPTPTMLQDFEKAYRKYPKIKAFWGGSYADITTEKIANITHLEVGLNSLINKDKKYGATRILKSKQFLKDFFRQQIFPHYLWNASLVSRELVEKTNGVPEYDSAHFSDYAYLLEIAAQTPFVIINKEMAIFTLHELNYGRGKDTLEEYKRGAIGFDKIAASLAKKFDCEKDYQKFMSDYIIMFLLNRLEHYKAHKYDISTKALFNVYQDLGKNLTFLKKRERELYVKLSFYYKYKNIYAAVNAARKIYGKLK